MNRNNDCPCNGCTERWVSQDGTRPLTCHCVCKRYKAWVDAKAAEKAELAIAREAWCTTHACKKVHWKHCRRDNYKSHKKFSQ